MHGDVDRACKNCGETYTAHSSNSKYCRPSCGRAWNILNMVQGPRTCKKCKLPKNTSEFYTHDTGKLLRTCKECLSKYYKDKNVGPRDDNSKTPFQLKMKIYDLKTKYGLSLEDFKGLLKKQDGRCAICKVKGQESVTRLLCVDHCHKTGEVRGLLCTKCNSGIGYLGDNLERLISAVSYLGKYDYLEDLLADRAGNDYCYSQYEISRGK